MEAEMPKAPFTDPEIRKWVHEKISAIRAYEDDIPGILIVHALPDFSVLYMSQRGLSILKVSLDEIQMGNAEYHSRFFNQDDVPNYLPKILGLIERNDLHELVSFFQQVRPSPEHPWTWYLSALKILLHDRDGKPLLTLTTAVPIDARSHVNTKVERILHEKMFLRDHKQVFASLTRREKEILKLMALGLSSGEMAEQLHISEATALTHRRNIRTKLNAQNNYDITRFAQAFDII